MLIIIGGSGIGTYIGINLHGLRTCTRIGRKLHVQPKLCGCCEGVMGLLDGRSYCNIGGAVHIKPDLGNIGKG